MKTLFKILPLLALLFTFASCQKDGTGSKIKGEYKIENDNVLVINEGTAEIAADYAESSVDIKAKGDDKVDVTLNNIINGYDSFVVNCVVELTKADDSYIFSGSSSVSDIEVNLVGEVSAKKLVSLKVNFSLKNQIVGKWMLGEKQVAYEQKTIIAPNVFFNFSTATDNITIAGKTIPVLTLVEHANLAMMEAAASLESGYVEFGANGYVSISGKDDSNKIISYSVNAGTGNISFGVKPSIVSTLNLLIAETGIQIPVTSLSVNIPYTYAEGKLVISINKTTIAPLLLIAKSKLPTLTYAQIKPFVDDPNFTEERFNYLKQVAVDIIDALSLDTTTITIGTELIPYKSGDRPWTPSEIK